MYRATGTAALFIGVGVLALALLGVMGYLTAMMLATAMFTLCAAMGIWQGIDRAEARHQELLSTLRYWVEHATNKQA
jgi:hypothetical protein